MNFDIVDGPSFGRREQDRLALDALTVTLGLTAWVALGGVVLAAADGFGEHPVRRGLIGGLLVAATVAGLLGRRAVCNALCARPWLVVAVAAAQILGVILDEPVGGAYVAFSLTSIGLAIVAARALTVWVCVAVLAGVYGLAVFSVYSPAELSADGDLGGVVGVLLSYPVIALLLLALRRLLQRLDTNADRILAGIRAGGPLLTPALEQAVAGSGGPLLLAGPHVQKASAVRLTPAEIRVVEGLARGNAPKQLALETGTALATIRTHIKHAKRKTGARTLRELAGLAAHPEWPDVTRLPR